MLKYQVIKSVTSVLVVFILKLTLKFGWTGCQYHFKYVVCGVVSRTSNRREYSDILFE